MTAPNAVSARDQDGVSFIVTVFNKAPYLRRVIASLAAQTGDFPREFIFVDDGSSDGSAELILELAAHWPETVRILRQSNRGASAATNAGARSASLPWLKLLDGDDLLAPGATECLLKAAGGAKESFAYGDLGTYRQDGDDAVPADPPAFPAERLTDGLAQFIRNCPANSSSMLISADRYQAAGGCDERLVSPDQALFLRLFAVGGGVHVKGPVAFVPEQAPGRLSGQTRRSRYESALALFYLVLESKNLSPFHARLAYRRVMSRAVRFHRAHGGGLISGHLWRYLVSRLKRRADTTAMFWALGAFTEDGRPERPAEWLPGAVRG